MSSPFHANLTRSLVKTNNVELSMLIGVNKELTYKIHNNISRTLHSMNLIRHESPVNALPHTYH